MRRRITIVIMILFALLLMSTACVHAGTKSNDRWAVTQYKSTRSNAMCYTIVDAKGRLAIIDGGWRSDADQLKRIIRRHHNTVNVWIVTHPHPDHVGALNRILEERSKNRIRIKKIYTVKVDAALYRQTATPFDQYEEYEKFVRLTRGEKVIFVKENQKLKVLGLKMQVLSAWPTKYLRHVRAGVCNLGSMVFKISGKKKSMLFCGDCRKRIQNRLVKRQKKKLKATYVQCAHHGRDGFSNSFYRRIKAEKAFIDISSREYMTSTQGLTPNALMIYLRSIKTGVLTWETAPNTVILR